MYYPGLASDKLSSDADAQRQCQTGQTWSETQIQRSLRRLELKTVQITWPVVPTVLELAKGSLTRSKLDSSRRTPCASDLDHKCFVHDHDHLLRVVRRIQRWLPLLAACQRVLHKFDQLPLDPVHADGRWQANSPRNWLVGKRDTCSGTGCKHGLHRFLSRSGCFYQTEVQVLFEKEKWIALEAEDKVGGPSWQKCVVRSVRSSLGGRELWIKPGLHCGRWHIRLIQHYLTANQQRADGVWRTSQELAYCQSKCHQKHRKRSVWKVR